MALGRSKRYARIKAAPKRARRKTVKVRGYCRRRGLVGWIEKEAASKGMPF